MTMMMAMMMMMRAVYLRMPHAAYDMHPPPLFTVRHENGHMNSRGNARNVYLAIDVHHNGMLWFIHSINQSHCKVRVIVHQNDVKYCQIGRV